LKILKIFLFCVGCLFAFLTVTAASCAFRVRYGSLARLNTSMAYSYADLFGTYSLLQYNQAGGEQAKKAVLDYLESLKKMRDQGIQDPKNILHFDFAISYLRLYRLEMAAANSVKAEEYLTSAQTEFSSMGRKDASREFLIKFIETQEAREAKLYNSANDRVLSSGNEKR